MSANDDIQDALTRHQIFVLRYARGREREAAEAIESAIRQGIDRLEQVSESGRAIAENNIRDLNAYLVELGDDYADTFKNEIRDFGVYEAGVNTQILEKAVKLELGVPAPAQIQQAVFSNIMAIEPAKGYTVGSILEQFGRKNADTVSTIAREAILLGKSNQELTRDIMDIIPTQKRKAETLARTITNHTANTARNETMKENADILDGYKWLATLDSRTSLICASRDGIVYEVDDKNPKPPAHFNCRSTITFVVNPEYDLGADIEGTRPSKGDSKADVSADLNYDQWLRRQSPEFQNKVLGKSRAQLFRNGVTMDKFVDDRGGVLSLSQLRNMDGEFNGVLADIPAAVPQPIPKPTKVLPSMFSGVKNASADDLNAVFEEIGTPEMGKLQQFMQGKRIKSVMISERQMGRGSKTSLSIADDVGQYLLDDVDPEPLYKDMRSPAGGVNPFRARQLFTYRKRKGKAQPNGFTSASYRHVVVKTDTKASFKNPKQIAERIKDVVQRFSTRSTTDRPWSFSNGVLVGYKDTAGRTATTMLHELGHQVHYYAGFPDFPEALADLRITQYGTFNSAESHAELFVAWVVDRDSLFKRSPEVARYFDDLVEKAIESSERSTGGI